MAHFSATDAALEGFRITRERPRALLAWIVFSILVSAAGAVLSLNMPQEAKEALDSLNSDEAPNPEALAQMLSVLAPLLLLGLAVQRTLDAAVFRLMLRPERERFGCLAFGMDELRLMALRLIFIVMGVLFLFVVQLAIGIAAFAASPLGQSVSAFVLSLGELFVLGLMLFVAVRLSLASVLTFDRRKLSLLDSWRLTKGHFWRLLGAYLLALCCAVVLGILVLILFSSLAGIALMATGGSLTDLGAILQPEEVTLSTYLNPFMIAYVVVGSIFSAVYAAVIAAPGAFAFLKLKAD